jgi:hypothetical protein
MRAAGKVVAELVDEQDAQQRERESETGGKVVGMAGDPGPGPKIAVANTGRHSLNKILHEARAAGSGGNDAGGQQQSRQAILPKI